MTPFKLADNQRDGNPGSPSISEESMTIDQHISNETHLPADTGYSTYT